MFKELANDLSKVMTTKYRAVKPKIIKDVQNAQLSLVELRRIEDNPRYLTTFDENSDEDVNRVMAYASIFAKHMPDAIDIKKYETTSQAAPEVESGIILDRAYKIAPNQYSCIISVQQAARLMSLNKILLSNSVWTSNKRYEKESIAVSNKIKAGSYCYKAVYLMIERLKYYEDTHSIVSYGAYSAMSGEEQLAACRYLTNDALHGDNKPRYLNDCFPAVICVGDDISDYLDEFDERSIPSKPARQIISFILKKENGMNENIIDNFGGFSNGAFNPRIMADNIDFYYSDLTLDKVEDIGKYMVEYFNEFHDIFPDMSLTAGSRYRNNLLYNSSCYVWHILLSSLIYYDRKRDPDFNWKPVLRETLDIDWSRDGEFAQSMPAPSNLYRDIIDSFFRERYNNVKCQI